MKRLFLLAVCACLLLGATSAYALKLVPAGTYASGVFDESAAEIVAYDMEGMRVYVVNAHKNVIDVIDVSDIKKPVKAAVFDFSKYGNGANSVAYYNGMIAVAVEAKPKQNPGTAVVVNRDGKVLGAFRTGALPDMITFTPDGKYILVACEGEPNDAYDNDPEGSVSVIDISNGIDNAVNRSATFTAFNDMKAELQAQGVRISGPNASVAQDVEPEYIAVSEDSKTAYVSLQENNALAVVDIEKAEVTAIHALGLKDWSIYVMDASDKDKKINLKTWGIYSAYMPDAVASYSVGGNTYIVSANEGDSREYGDYADEARLGKVTLDPAKFPNAAELQEKKNLGRLKTIPDLSDTDGDGDYDRIVGFGGRSFSIWTTDGTQVYDSGDQFELILAKDYPEYFNTTNDEHKFDNRSDDKGCEAEAAEVGTIDGKTYAFIGLERMGGIMVYDVTNPKMPKFMTYQLDRDFSGDPEKGKGGDLGPEGLKFVPAAKSHTGKDMLIVGNEVSGTTTIYEVVQ